jgi:catenin alpha
MPNFAQRVEVAVDALSSNPPKDVDENEFIDASRLVYDGVREIRRAVLMNRVSKNFLFYVQINWYSEDILCIMLL